MAAGLKLTHQRMEIYKEIAMREDHPDAETVFEAVRLKLPSVSLDTVYRTLWTLADLGMIATISPRRDNQRFDGNPDRHHHFICVRCGLIRDFLSAELDSLRLPGSIAEFGQTIGTHVEVRGLCAECINGAVPRAAHNP